MQAVLSRREAAPAPPRRRRRLAAALPAAASSAVLAALGGSLVLQRQSLWYDELYSVEVGTAGLGALGRAVLDGTGTRPYLADIPPSYNAPYYVVVHLWLAATRLPADDVGVRLLSLLAAVAAVAVLARAVQRLAGPAVAAAAGLLTATNPLVVEYSAEGRMYGLALLATATTALGLVRWLDGARGGLALYGVGATLAGLAHWFTLPVLAGLALAAVVLRRRAAVPVVVATALAALPTLGLVLLLLSNGTSSVGWIRRAGAPVPALALQEWSGRSAPLLVAVIAAVLVAVVRAARVPATRPVVVVGAAWVGVPLALVQAGDLLRPVFVPRYLLAGLAGTAVLAAAGVAAGRWRVPLTGGLVVLSVLAALPLLDRGPREDARGAVEALAALHAVGEPVVAVDERAALALEHYGPPSLLGDVRTPPEDAPSGADVVWLLRQSTGPQVRPSDDDVLLQTGGLRLLETRVFVGSNSDFALQRWAR